MKTLTVCTVMAVMAVATSGCKGAKDAGVVTYPAQGEVRAPVRTIGSNPTSMIPKAVIYKTNGDYNDHVTVTLNPEGTAIVSYPDPTDVSEAMSTPISLKNGWLLDRRGGIGPRTAFLTYTYGEYSRLQKAPSPSDLLKCIIEGAKVEDYRVLPININEAFANPSEAMRYVP